MNKLIYYILDEDEKNIYGESDNISLNNNDSFQFVLTTILYIKNFFCFIYYFLISIIMIMKIFINNRIFIIFISIIILFKFTSELEDNSGISTNLIINAYFLKNNVTRITFEMIQNKENKEAMSFPINKGDIDIININLTSFFYLENKITNIFLKDTKDLIYEAKKTSINNFFINNTKIHKETKKKSSKKNEINEKIKVQDDDILVINKNKLTKKFELNFNNIFLTIFCFLFVFLFIRLTYKKKRGFFILYLVFLFISYYLMNILYQNKYYLASNFIFIFLIYTNKNLIDSIYLLLKYKRKDFEIFTTNLIAINIKQFFLKLILLIYLTFFSGIISIIVFNYWLNYILYFLCLLNLFGFSANCLEKIAPYNLKPIKNIIFFFFGIFNLFLSKFLLKIVIFNNKINYNEKNKMNYFKFNSFYFINDLFSLYCINYINGYIKYQYNRYSNKNNFLNDNIQVFNKNYLLLNFLFFLTFIAYLGIYKDEFICAFISLFIAKITLNFIIKFYHYKICIIVNYLIICFFLILSPRIFQIKDYYFLSLFLSLTNLNKEIFLFSIKFIFIIALFYYLIIIYFSLYTDFKFLQIKQEQKFFNNYNAKFYILIIIYEIILQFIITCLVSIISKFYEKNLIIKSIYFIMIIFFHLLKIPLINEFKEKGNNNEYIINYYFFLFILVIFSIRLVELSESFFYFLYVMNHLNLIFIINYFILYDKNISINFQLLLIGILCISYYRMKSCIYVIEIYNVLFFLIFKINYIYTKKKNNNNWKYKNRHQNYF